MNGNTLAQIEGRHRTAGGNSLRAAVLGASDGLLSNLIYEAKGLPEAQARTLAAKIMTNQTTALDTLAREELGIEPDELGGSAWAAAITSFFLFAIGAIIPVAPFILLTGNHAVVASLLVSSLGLFVIGTGITLLTGRSIFYSGMRQVVFGFAAAITFGVGRLIGITIQ